MGFHGTYPPWNIQPWTFLSGNFRSWDFISRKILAFGSHAFNVFNYGQGAANNSTCTKK